MDKIKKWLAVENMVIYWNSDDKATKKAFHFYYHLEPKKTAKRRQKKGAVKVLRHLTAKSAGTYLDMPSHVILSNPDDINLIQAGKTVDDQKIKMK